MYKPTQKLIEEKEEKKKKLIEFEKQFIPTINLINIDEYIQFLISSNNEALTKKPSMDNIDKTLANIDYSIAELQKLADHQNKEVPFSNIDKFSYLTKYIDEISTEPTN